MTMKDTTLRRLTLAVAVGTLVNTLLVVFCMLVQFHLATFYQEVARRQSECWSTADMVFWASELEKVNGTEQLRTPVVTRHGHAIEASSK